jgi:hypothetical protein
MKKITFCVMITCLSLTFHPLQSNAETTPTPCALAISKSIESEKAGGLLIRLNEINAMDKSDLNSSDKRNLRREVRSIEKQLRETSGGVYISVGALIIIVLLLIILF